MADRSEQRENIPTLPPASAVAENPCGQEAHFLVQYAIRKSDGAIEGLLTALGCVRGVDRVVAA